MQLKEQKYNKRKEFREIRSQVSAITKKQIYQQVKKFLAEVKKRKKRGKFFGIYWPLPGEINLLELKNSKNMRIALPRCLNESKMNYYAWEESELIKDFAGIPAPLSQNLLKPEELELLLVPALAIDKHAIRLGYGGGYFDFLRSQPKWKKIPAFIIIPEACISNVLLPREDWDIPFDGWISEKGKVIL